MNKTFKILIVTNSLILLAGAMLGPIYAVFVEENGGDVLDASLIFSIFTLSAGITTIVSGRLADKLPHQKYLVIFGYTVITLGYVCYTFVNNMNSLAIVQIIIGFGEAIYSPAFDSLISKHLDKDKEGTEWGIWEANYYFTTAIGAFLGGVIVKEFGFTTLFVVMAIVSSFSVVLLINKKVDGD
ncbi:MAG: MFS transporter [Candidatus Dojkabacteria bacterium]|nr:MFS transporter [Candidatus Dojkabacteria bacterium]MDQ7020647.1 MFS transporter [Candidatus Dojkabacteria bacterium]